MKLVYQSRGEGTPLVLVHGLFGSADNLGGIARILAEDYRVISVDLRNHGRSPHAQSMTYHEMAVDVLEVLDREAIASTHIFGHSMGGKTAMQLAIDHPARINRLVVGDIAPVRYPPHHSQIFKGMRTVSAAAPSSRKAAQEILATFEPERAVLGFLMTNWRRTQDGSWQWRINLDAIEGGYSDIAAGNTGGPYNGNTLFLRGGDSDYIQVEHRDTILSLFPKATVRTIEGTGHWLHAEKPDMVARAISRFFMA